MGTVVMKQIPVQVEPLTGDEIKAGIIHKIAEAVRESLDRQGLLYQRSFPKFSARWSMTLTIDDFGLTKEINPSGELKSDGEIESPLEVVAGGEVVETPPNQFRRETGQDIPTQIKGPSGESPHGATFYQPKGKKSR